ncbi:MAG: phosphoribosyltransferase family protein [Limnohabitans sp.]
MKGWSLPSRCAICRQWPAAPVCDTCIARFAQPRMRCLYCALPVPEGVPRCGSCLKNPPPLDRCLCAVDYAWPWRGLVARFKFHEQPGWDKPLAWLMRSAELAEDTLHEADRVLPIPLSRERLAQRGYNQSWLLARQLAPDKADAGLLLRTRDTPAQHTLPRDSRLANLQGTLAVDPLRAHEVRGRRLVLVDDVMTTGASLHTAARALRQAGAAQVCAIVLARTGQDDDGTDDATG